MDAPVHGHDYQRHSGAVYHSLRSKNPWITGYIRRLPTAGILAAIGAILGIGACAGILVASDRQPISYWKFPPSVYLAICSTLTNIFLAFALSEGAEIAWWRKAGSQRTTVADLHRAWSHGKSFWQALTAGKNMTLVAAACLLATIAQINSPLLQRASTVSVTTVPSNVKLSIRGVATEVPSDFVTGYASGRGLDVTLFTNKYLKTVQEWNNNISIPIERTACSGHCATKLQAMGLHVNCSTFKVPFDIKPQTFPNGTFDVTSSVVGANVFNTDFHYDIRQGPNMTFQATYKNTTNCEGDLTVERCTIQIANMQFPVVIDGNKSTVALTSTIYQDKFGHFVNIPYTNTAGPGPAALGGFYLALHNRFYSNASIRFTGAVGPYTVLTEGNTALQYAIINETEGAWSSCNTSFSSPTDDILGAARELMFRTSIFAANSSTPVQTIDNAIDDGSRAVWRSNYYYMAGAIAITLIATFVVLSIFNGYSQLGRNPSMSPIEIAKAFNAPLLQSHDDNAEADDLIRDVGGRSVRYGAVTEITPTTQFTGHGIPTEYKPYNPHVQEVMPRRRLVMGDESQVRKPESGEVFTSS